MISLTFRFYGELNDFLPFAYRYHEFRCAIRDPAPVKDAIEALGVPHPEVDVLLINGRDGEFSRDARVVLTRDVGLLKRAVIQYGYWVRRTDPDRQLAEVLARFGLVDRMQPFTRCLACNTPLIPADAASVADRLPARTRESFQQFHECPGCARVYWPGSHYARLRELIDRVRQP